LLASATMSTVRRRGSLVVTTSIVCFLAVATPLAAQTVSQADPPHVPHVRPTPDLRGVVVDAVQQSDIIRELVETLETLDVTVYIRTRPFRQLNLDGRIALLSVVGGHRYLVIELSCTRSTLTQMATLGHELFHAVEIAREPSVVDARTLAALYEHIGMETGGGSAGQRMFETGSAINAGQRARKQLVKGTRSANGT
jgi:hypothetical protein